MKTLLIDIGNTRIKWALVSRGRLGRMHADVHAGWTRQDFVRHLFGRLVGQHAIAPVGSARRILERRSGHATTRAGFQRKGDARGVIQRILVVSVAGDRVDRLVTAAALSQLGVRPEFFASERSVAGVTTMYAEPWRLGADRLAGAIGAHRIARGRAVCFIGVGTALTLDLIDEQGRHLGGAIVPAPPLMKGSLLTKTNGIRRRAHGVSSSGGFFARNTHAAIEQGSRYAAAAVIDRAVLEARTLIGRTPLVLVTGGGALAIRRLIRSRHVLVPDLVLQGLAVVASASGNSMAQPIGKRARGS